ncbi:LamG-like jellyroll fold domain-containing protein [Streptomyces sp. NPDC096205]|uniref:LamG-like jellyroll fold domain-containing protein n=1 Tax=Streptomyces sp. NPDC096205 TaxID=3366081 RepID=UPI0038204A14
MGSVKSWWGGTPASRARRTRSVVLGGVAASLVLTALPALPISSAAVGSAAAAEASTGAAQVSTGAVDEETALEKARKTGELVEVLSLRGEASEVFATPDGNLEAREYLRPTWTRSGGAWRRVDTDLAATTNGMVAPKATTVDLEFSGGGSDAPLVRMERAGRELSLSWPTALPEPQLSGAVATYPEVLPGVDLRMTAQEDGFTQLLVVKSAEAAANPKLAELRLKLNTDGMTVHKTAQGGLEAVDDGAKGTVFEAPKPLMWDSSAGESSPALKTLALAAEDEDDTPVEPGAGESGKLAQVGVELPVGNDELVLIPDQDVLKGPDTEYPVFIDPQWYSPQASAWTMASKYWASSPQWKFNGESDAGMGYCDWYYCQPHDTKRLFYRIPVSAFAGKSILSAEFVVRNTWSASCSDRYVELWQTQGISDSTTWNSQNATGFWVKQLGSKPFAYGFSGCSAAEAEFDVKSAVQAAANNREATMTFGLRAANETDGYGWKRFSDKAFLRVQYNRPPAQLKMSQLTMRYGGTCKTPSNAEYVRTLGLIYATDVTDPDGDSVAVQFQAKWDGGSWTPARTSFKASGSSFSISLPESTPTKPTPIPEHKSIGWYARVYDGAQYSAWSYAGDASACYFLYDKQAPATPKISSVEYPESDMANPEDPWYDGVGQYGTFTIDGVNSDVTTYLYGINGSPSPLNKITTSGGAAQFVKVLPTKPGLNFFMAQAIDAAGRTSAPYTYFFRVKAGQPDRATWQLDEDAGVSEAKGSTPARTLKLQGGTTAGVAGVTDTAVQFNGDGYASTDLSPVDTTQGFTVSAWAKFDRQPDQSVVVAAQPGNIRAGFQLYYSPVAGWVFSQHSADTADATLIRAQAATPAPVTVGKWTHVAGSYDAGLDLLRLYVDGQLVGEKIWSTPWNARRGLILGAGSSSGVPGNFFPGVIDEVQIFNRQLEAGEVGKLYAKQTVGDPGSPALAVFGMNDKTDDAKPVTEIEGHGGVLSATYHGTVTTGVEGIAGKATRFDGTTGYGQIGTTGAPHVNTFRSFTVSAWARLDKLTQTGVVAAQAGKERPGFELYYSAAAQKWVFAQYSADSADAGIVRATQLSGAVPGEGDWAHLVGVHDTVANTLTLYVNGVKVGSATQTSPFYAAQSMYIGAASFSGTTQYFFPGTVDDVRVLDRPVSAQEVQQMFQQRPLLKTRWKFEETSATSPVTTPDDAKTGNKLTLLGGASKVQDLEAIDGHAMKLDGTGGYATADSVPADTSGSFTLTAWAQAVATPDRPVTLVSAEGSNQGAFTVRFVPDASGRTWGRWQLAVADKNAADATVVKANNGEVSNATAWHHLALVYDGFAKQARLYVDGTLDAFTCPDADGDGEADDSACEDRVPWAENALAFKATSLQIGRYRSGTAAAGSYFPGLVDDVWTFQGVLTDAQVNKMAGSLIGLPTKVPGD